LDGHLFGPDHAVAYLLRAAIDHVFHGSKETERSFTALQDAAGVLEFSDFRGISNLPTFIRNFSESDTKFVIDNEIIQELLLPPIETNDTMKDVMKEIDRSIQISDDQRGLVLSIQEDILFDSGSAHLKMGVLPILDSVARAIQSYPNHVLIMGHSDNVPIHTARYSSNWELSNYRGLAVLNYFLEEKGLDAEQFSVGGYGASRPVVSNNTPDNRALNRRVEIIFRHLGRN